MSLSELTSALITIRKKEQFTVVRYLAEKIIRKSNSAFQSEGVRRNFKRKSWGREKDF